MKRWISLLLALALALPVLSGLAEGEEGVSLDADQPEVGEEIDLGLEMEADTSNWVMYDYEELTVGNPTQMHGQLFTDLWGNITSDIDVRQLAAGYNLVIWDGELSQFRPDHSVVSGMVVEENREGGRRYVFSLYHDLLYSDGTPITAWDYAFSVLFQCSPLIAELGGVPARYDFLKGFDDYLTGKQVGLAGLQVLDNWQLAFEVNKESLPYFYELARFAICPYPIQTIAPGCRVLSDAKGSRIINEDETLQEPLFTAELLRRTVLSPDTGYLVHPVPCSGPYELQTFDGTTAILELNPWYKGNEDGVRPHIRKLIYTWSHNESMIQKLGNGEFGLLNKVTLGETINQGMTLGRTSGQFTMTGYPRTGLTYFYFMPTSDLMQSVNLRKALAYSLKKPEFLQAYTAAYGLEMDGMYGLGQWMYQLATGAMEPPIQISENPTEAETRAYESTLAEWEEINLDGLTRYAYDPDQAAALLEADGWTLNESGQPFRPGEDALRYRRTEAGLQPLEITLAYTDKLEETEPLETCLAENLRKLGAGCTMVTTSIDHLGDLLGGTQEASYDVIYLGNNFTSAFAPDKLFRPGTVLWQEGQAEDSIPAVHAEMRQLAQEMDATEPLDVLGYMRKWLKFQQRLTETLPILPVYSNVYFDFFTRELHDYWIASYSNWGDAIVPARMYEVEDIDEDAEEQDPEGGVEETDTDVSRYYSARHQKEQLEASAGALAAFPRKVRAAIPEDYRTINEFISATLSDNYQNIKSATLQFSFETVYPAGETVYLIFGVMKGGRTSWFVEEAKVNETGAVDVKLQKEQLDRLAGTVFPLVVVSKQ